VKGTKRLTLERMYLTFVLDGTCGFDHIASMNSLPLTWQHRSVPPAGGGRILHFELTAKTMKHNCRKQVCFIKW